MAASDSSAVSSRIVSCGMSVYSVMCIPLDTCASMYPMMGIPLGICVRVQSIFRDADSAEYVCASMGIW